MDLADIGCCDERRLELPQDRVQWRAMLLAVLSIWDSYKRLRWSVSKLDN
jgi:hypothetical protein